MQFVTTLPNGDDAYLSVTGLNLQLLDMCSDLPKIHLACH